MTFECSKNNVKIYWNAQNEQHILMIQITQNKWLKHFNCFKGTYRRKPDVYVLYYYSVNKSPCATLVIFIDWHSFIICQHHISPLLCLIVLMAKVKMFKSGLLKSCLYEFICHSPQFYVLIFISISIYSK